MHVAHGIVIAFPGTGYTCKEPLFADCIGAYRARGYSCIELDYSCVPFKQIKTVSEALDKAQALALEQIKDVAFVEYEDVVFISKSLGTALAGRLAQRLDISPRQLFLTPIPELFAHISEPARVIGMVTGTEDRVLDYRTVEKFCAQHGISCMTVSGVGHNLKYEDAEKTEALNRSIVAMCAGSQEAGLLQ